MHRLVDVIYVLTLFFCIFEGPIFPGRKSWRSEVKRLVHHVPCVESEIFTDAHSDEVLDVSISHNGEYFCTTSKDSCIIVRENAILTLKH